MDLLACGAGKSTSGLAAASVAAQLPSSASCLLTARAGLSRVGVERDRAGVGLELEPFVLQAQVPDDQSAGDFLLATREYAAR